MLHSLVIQSASVQDRVGAKVVLEKAKKHLFKLKKIWADGGYTGTLKQWATEQFDWDIEIIEKTPGLKTFQALPKRWVVERTFPPRGCFAMVG